MTARYAYYAALRYTRPSQDTQPSRIAEGMSLYPKKVQKEWRGLDKGVGV